MIPDTFRLRPVLLAGLLAAASPYQAFALEAQEVADRFKALMALQQIELSYSAANLAGGDVTLEGVTVKPTGGEQSFDLGQIVLQDVTEAQDGSFRVGTLEMDAFEHSQNDITVSMTDLSIEGLVLPDDPASDPFGGAMRYDRMELARVNVEGKDGPLASATNLYADVAVGDDNTMAMDGAIESFSLNLASLVEDAEGANTLDEMGYSELGGKAVMEASWQPSDGRLTVSRYEMAVDDAGTLNMTMDLAGYTPAFIKSLDETMKAMEQQPEGSENQSMQGMAMLGLMQQLTLHGVTIRFADDSLTGKVLEQVAEKQGSTPADLISLAKAAIPQQLSPFVGAELAASISQAVGTFLENPQNIEVSVKPANPLPFAMLAAAAMTSPEALVKQLGLAVTANQ
ncbi:hypothetical protein [Chelativorans sp.]|uniref:hypothetical protein n=1 Tax=Chelativorans sp. TaxID=2203393 RepID=UPI0028113E71|nr:hypothetical protein [Chelativorans sp.]